MNTTDMIALGAASITGVGLLITIAGIVVSRAANSINRNSSRRQIAVAERQMFLSLVEKRTAWMIDYTDAFMRRQREWRVQAHVLHGLAGATEFPWEGRLHDLHVIAGWLFDQEIIDDLADIDRAQSKALSDYSDWLTKGNRQLPYFEPGPDAEGMDLAHNALGTMNGHMNRFLYVGAFKRIPAVASMYCLACGDGLEKMRYPNVSQTTSILVPGRYRPALHAVTILLFDGIIEGLWV